MRRLLLTGLLLAAVALPAVAEPQAERPAAAEPQAERPSGALMRLHEKSHDFGDVPRRGGDLVCEFRFTNEGSAPLVLTRVVTSCSCLKMHYPRRPVEPGGEGVIRIVYEPQKSEPGIFNKVVYIYSNTEGGREVISVHGNSVEGESVKVKSGKVKIRH